MRETKLNFMFLAGKNMVVYIYSMKNLLIPGAQTLIDFIMKKNIVSIINVI